MRRLRNRNSASGATRRARKSAKHVADLYLFMLSVSLDNISKRFGQTLAVDGVSLDVREGELFILLGPSGCGKTTCLRMVAGFEQPDAGVLRFGERDMTRIPPHKRNTGMVFQNYALWPHLTTKGNVEYGLKVRRVEKKERERRVREALEMVRLEGLADRYPSQMSGGQQQRVALARALIIRPDVLLLDEPLSNLDAQLRLEMRAEIKRLHDQTKTTALYVTHDQEEALSIADRIAVLKDGVLQQVGAPRDLYRRPASRFVAEFLGETNFIPGVLRAIDGNFCQVETPIGNLRAVVSESTIEIGQNIWCAVRPESWRVADSSDENNAHDNRFAARLQSVMYLGASEQYRVLLSGGVESARAEAWREVKVAVANPRQSAPTVDSPLELLCAPEDVVILKN
jgi:iron(III) transport system ATP-binding protein